MLPHRARAAIFSAAFIVASCAASGHPTAFAQTSPSASPTVELESPALVPTEPQAVSRPESWPTAKKTTSADNHVLSSIRDNPGAPLEPLGTVTADALAGGVMQAQYTETFTPPALPPSANAPTADLARLNMQSLETAMVVARVGSEVVLESDLMTPTAAEWLAKVSPGLTPEQIRELKLQIYRQVLKPHVESLLVYVDACRTIPEDRLPDIEKKVNEAFNQQQLPRLMKEAGVANSLEYEQLLKSRGQSLDRMRKMFFERALSQQWMQSKVETNEEIPHAEMIAWYENHLAEYELPAKARFEQLTVRITPERPRDQAWNMLAAMGNEVFHGAPFADVARAKSEGPTAANGGAYDWTTKGSLVSKAVDEAVFTLPVGQLSAIIDDGSALHIVRISERTEAGRTPFIEAQVEIKKNLLEERRSKQIEDYLTRLRERTPVWTVFDGEQPGTVMAGRAAAAPR